MRRTFGLVLCSVCACSPSPSAPQWCGGKGAVLEAWGAYRILSTPGRYSAIAAGEDYSLALRDDGTVDAWGRDGNSDSGRPVPPPRLSGVVSIGAAKYGWYAIKADGTAVGT